MVKKDNFYLFSWSTDCVYCGHLIWFNRSHSVSFIPMKTDSSDPTHFYIKPQIDRGNFFYSSVTLIVSFLVELKSGSIVVLSHCQSLGSKNEILVFFLFLLVLDLSSFVRGAIEGVLSSVALWIFFAILPLVSA